MTGLNSYMDAWLLRIAVVVLDLNSEPEVDYCSHDRTSIRMDCSLSSLPQFVHHSGRRSANDASHNLGASAAATTFTIYNLKLTRNNKIQEMVPLTEDYSD